MAKVMYSGGRSDAKPYIFVPARSGSKSIRHKNLRLVGGVPLLLNAIHTALSTGLKTVVSSDNEGYLALAECFDGCELHRRDPALAGDDADVWDSVADYLRKSMAVEGAICILLEPTSPFVLARDVIEISNWMHGNTAQAYATNVAEVPATHNLINQRVEQRGGALAFAFPARRGILHKQEHPSAFVFGNLHAVSPEFIKTRQLPSTMPLLRVPLIRAISIDSMEDLELANAISFGVDGELGAKFLELKANPIIAGSDVSHLLEVITR